MKPGVENRVLFFHFIFLFPFLFLFLILSVTIMASGLIPESDITIDDAEDRDVFGVLDDDNDSYLSEMPFSGLSQVWRSNCESNRSAQNATSDKLNTKNPAPTIKCNRVYEFPYDASICDDYGKAQKSEYERAKQGETESAEGFQPKHRAAKMIQGCWRRYAFRRVFRRIRNQLIEYSGCNDSSAILKFVNPREADLMDRASGTFIRFRLSGENFPPAMVYKIFTKRPIVDLCKQENNFPPDVIDGNSSRKKSPLVEKSPYFPTGRFVRVNEDAEYERIDRNYWRPFLGSLAEKVNIFKSQPTIIQNRAVIRVKTIKKRRLKLEMIKQLYENGRQKELEREIEMARKN